jgi:hypothetical protein
MDSYLISALVPWHRTDIMESGSRIAAIIRGRYDTLYTVFQTSTSTILRRMNQRGEPRFAVELSIDPLAAIYLAVDIRNNVFIASLLPDCHELELRFVTQWGAMTWKKTLQVTNGVWLQGGVVGHENLALVWGFTGTLATAGITLHGDSVAMGFTPSGDPIYTHKIIGEASSLVWSNEELYVTGRLVDGHIFVQTMNEIGHQLNRYHVAEPVVEKVHDAVVVGDLVYISGILENEGILYAYMLRYSPTDSVMSLEATKEVGGDLTVQSSVMTVGRNAAWLLEVQDFGSIFYFNSEPVHRFSDQLVKGKPRVQEIDTLTNGTIIAKAGRFAGTLSIDEVIFDVGREGYTGYTMVFVTPRIIADTETPAIENNST